MHARVCVCVCVCACVCVCVLEGEKYLVHERFSDNIWRMSAVHLTSDYKQQMLRLEDLHTRLRRQLRASI